eukprot:SAG22_NODE_11647_length_475_cov_1.752660_1_plen_83_part_01
MAARRLLLRRNANGGGGPDEVDTARSDPHAVRVRHARRGGLQSGEGRRRGHTDVRRARLVQRECPGPSLAMLAHAGAPRVHKY